MDKFGILFHERFPYLNLSEEEGDFYLSIILNSKELNESERKININNSCTFSLIQLNMNKKDDFVVFDGIISNDYENRGINGIIKKIGNKTYLDMDVVLLDKNYAEFSFNEKFKFKDSGVNRITTYEDGTLYESFMDSFDPDDIYLFKESIVNQYKTR